MKPSLFLAGVLLGCVGVHGAEYYVDAGSRGGKADDEGPGNPARPWRTIGRAVGGKEPGPQPGDTVWVRGGTYAETVVVARGGTEQHPLSIKAFRGEKPVIDGEGRRGSALVFGERACADHVLVEGLTCTNFAAAGTAIAVTQRTGIVLSNLDVVGAGTGILLNGCRDSIVQKCAVHHCRNGLIDLDTACSNIVVADNHVYANEKGNGITCYAPGNVVRAEGAVVVERDAAGRARFVGRDLNLHTARGGTLFGQNAAGTVKQPSLVLFFQRPMKTSGPGNATSDKGIPGGGVRLADGREWFALRNNPAWGDKPYSPDGTQGLFEPGNARWDDLTGATYAWVAYVFDPSVAHKDIRIVGNHVHGAASQGIWLQRTENALIRGNRLHHNGLTGIQIESLCRRIWIELNVSYANNVRSIHETGIWLDETIDAVVQDNRVYENQKGMGITQCEWVLMRRNVFFNNQAQHVPEDKEQAAKGNAGSFWFAGGRGWNLGAPPGAEHNAFVHNTLVDNGADSSRWGGLQHGLDGYPRVGRNRFINNIVQNHRGALLLDLWNAPGGLDGNIYQGAGALHARWREEGTKESRTFTISEAAGLEAYRKASGMDAHSLVAKVEFVNPAAGDFRPAAGTVAIDKGQPLTLTTSTGQGADVPVEDVSCFSAGFRTSRGELLIPGDEIVVAGAPARIAAIDRERAVLKTDRSLTWRKGDPVAYLYQGAGPDVGAFEAGL